MPYIRKLPSGKWNAVVRLPNGSRRTHTARLKDEVVRWAREQEDLIRRGVTRDPRLGQTLLGDWFERWWKARSVAPTTAAKDESRWRTHVRPRWATWPMESIARIDIQAWVKAMTEAGVGAHTVVGSYHLLAAMLHDATLETPQLILASPCHDIDLPAIGKKRAKVFSEAQLTQLIAELPGQWRVYFELDSYTGLRPGELAGLHEDQVDWGEPCRITICRVLTRYGLREWPKTTGSNRVVPVPRRLRDELWTLASDRPAGAPLFTDTDGQFVGDGRLRSRIWFPALLRAGACPEHREQIRMYGHPAMHARMVACAACDPLPYYPPRVLRHTAGSLLLRAGVPKEQVMALLGHTRAATTDIYAQFEVGALPAVHDAWEARDPRLTHEGQRGHEKTPSPKGEGVTDSPDV